jgi:hypothetical protein
MQATATRHRNSIGAAAIKMQSSQSNEWTPLAADQQVYQHPRGGINTGTGGTGSNGHADKPCCSRTTFYIFLATAVILAICIPLIIVRTRPSSSSSSSSTSWPSITQLSTRDALASGIYDGNYTLKQLRGYGSFGLGTYNGLDGEMVAIDGDFYQVTETGARLAHDDWFVPFAVITNVFEGATGKDGAIAVATGYHRLLFVLAAVILNRAC